MWVNRVFSWETVVDREMKGLNVDEMTQSSLVLRPDPQRGKAYQVLSAGTGMRALSCTYR